MLKLLVNIKLFTIFDLTNSNNYTMKTKFSGFLTLLLAFLVQVTFAQVKTVSGTVSDDSGPLPGVSVLIKGTTSGTETDFDGKYVIKAKVGDVLQFRFIGMDTQEKTVGLPNTINVTLKSSNILEEVVVTGYGTTPKQKSNIASVTISAKSIEDRPNASFVQTLSGQVSGLNISTNSGQPGANSTVRIRGITSINGDTEPLFIIDGAPVDQDNFRSLNPNEIASISVLKDAGATAIYGNRGANGVIIIKTKGGQYNTKMKISYSGSYSFSDVQSNSYNLMDSQQQLTIEKQLGLGKGATLTDAEISQFKTTNWADVFFRTAQTKSHTLTISNGGKNMTSFTSLGFHEQEGIVVQSSLKRFNLRSNVTGKSNNDKFNYGLNLSINYSENGEPNRIGTGAINRNYILGAYISVPYKSPDDYTSGQGLLDSGFTFADTPLILYDRLFTFNRTENEVKMVGSLNASYKLTDELTIKGVWSADYQDQIMIRSQNPANWSSLFFAGSDLTPGFQQQQYTRAFSINQVVSLNYNKEFGKHTIDATLFTEYFKAHFQDFGFFENGLNLATFSHGDGSAFVADNASDDLHVDTVNANLLTAGLFSYFGQIDYDYDTRFGLTGTVRRDASFRFAESNRWGTFYSVAARWNISNESFMDDSVFDLLKIRGSYGTAGNQNINGSGTFSSPDLGRDLFATGSGYAGNNSLGLAQIGNSTLKWETVKSGNLGIDFEVFKRRLRGSIDAYTRKTVDLFQSTPVSAVTSVNSLSANIGDLKNEGFDVTLHYDLLKQDNGLNITLDFLGNYNKTEITDLPGDQTELIGTGRIGGKLFEYFDVRYAGVNPANGNLLFYTKDGNITENPNVDTDRVWLDKNIFPDYQGSFGFNASYKGFSLTTQFNYSIGVDRYDNDLNDLQDVTSIGQFRSSTDLLRAWTPTNRVTDIPSLRATNFSLGNDSTRYLTNADFVRLRFAQLAYSFPSKFLKDTGFSSIKLYTNAENLFTLTKWRGYDVDQASNGSRIFPTPRTISLGVEVAF
jgi:TonB-dependent starch-binding outer membrane protein SusC